MCLLGWLLILYLLIECLLSVYPAEEDLRECEIPIERVSLHNSFDKDTRMKLEIVSGGSTYYLWYSSSVYLDFAEAVKNELLTGEAASVSAKIVTDQSLYDRLTDRYRVADLRSGSSVFYDMEADRTYWQMNHIVFVVAVVILLVVWLSVTAVSAVMYGVLDIRKK